jgi:transcriptional regulator with XRE-family HTH domain
MHMTRTIRSDGLLALGRAIAEIRTSRGMSQRQFAESLECSYTFLAKIELGVRRLDVVEFVALARAMDVEAAELLARIQEATPLTQKILPGKHEAGP